MKRTSILAATALISALATTAQAAIVVDSSVFTSTARTIGTGPDLADVTRTSIYEGTLSKHDLTTYSAGVSQASEPFDPIPPGRASATALGFSHQDLGTTGEMTLLNPQIDARAYGSCIAARCSTWRGEGSTKILTAFTLDSTYEFEFKLASQFYFVPSVNGVQDLNTLGLLHSVTTGLDVFSQLLAVTSTGGPLSKSLIATGTIGPGTYYASLELFGGISNSTLAEGVMEGGGSSSFTLTAVPLPAAAWLLLSGVGAIGAFARRRRVAALATT
jgi:PEP-CTERM motif-containing protein